MFLMLLKRTTVLNVNSFYQRLFQ